MAQTESLTYKGSRRSIHDGERVRATIAERPHEDLDNDIRYLKYMFDEMSAGKALILPDQALGSTVTAYMPVYLDSSGTWQPAVSELSSTATSTLFTLTEKAYVSGVVKAISSTGVGDVVIAGQLMADSGVLACIDGAYAEGILYLSPFNAGKMTLSKGVAPVRVGTIYGPDSDGQYRLLVNPSPRVLLESHGHYHIALEDAPAGDPNCLPGKPAEIVWGDFEAEGPYPGVVHAVENPDTAAKGWLPADHSAFDGMNVPTGAKFGYNISADDDVKDIWPPLPIDHVRVVVDGNEENDDLVQVNEDGIWWMDNSYGKAPWPVNLPCGSSEESGSSSESYDIWPIRIDLWFTKVLHGTTLEAMENHVNVVRAVGQALEPAEVGVGIETRLYTGTDIWSHVLPYTIPGEQSSSAAGQLDDYSMVYTLYGHEYYGLGRTPSVAFELVLVGDAGISTTTIAEIMNGFNLYVSRLPDPGAGLTASVAGTLVRTSLGWSDAPDTTTEVPAGKVFILRSETVDISSGDVLSLRVDWDGSVMDDAADEVFLLAVRPVVTLS